MTDVLEELARVLEERKRATPDKSYVASLYAAGDAALCAKIEEEAAEVIRAAREQGGEELVKEVADLWFHSLVLLAHRDIPSRRVLDELERRFGCSGLDEKAARLRE